MTSTKTCNLMNGYYEILKGCTIDEIERMREIVEAEQPESIRPVMVYCCNETIRRKQARIWK